MCRAQLHTLINGLIHEKVKRLKKAALDSGVTERWSGTAAAAALLALLIFTMRDHRDVDDGFALDVLFGLFAHEASCEASFSMLFRYARRSSCYVFVEY
jgi:hypothetical protein